MSEWNVVDDLIHVGFRRQHEKKSEKYLRQLLNSLKSVTLRGCTGAVVPGAVEGKKMEMHLEERGEAKWEQG